MIEVKQAIAAAIESVKDFYGEPPDLLLEEVERSEDDKHWLITLGFSVAPATQPANTLQQLSAALKSPRRVYKVFRVDADTGKVDSMKIREAQAA